MTIYRKTKQNTDHYKENQTNPKRNRKIQEEKNWYTSTKKETSDQIKTIAQEQINKYEHISLHNEQYLESIKNLPHLMVWTTLRLMNLINTSIYFWYNMMTKQFLNSQKLYKHYKIYDQKIKDGTNYLPIKNLKKEQE